MACAPVSGKSVAAWSKVAGSQAVVLWQSSQDVSKPLATWSGSLVFSKSDWWQA